MKNIFISAFLVIGGIGLCSSEEAHVQADLVAEVQSIQPGASFDVAVRLTIDDGWHVYWKNPGDSGLPVKVEWQLPEGFQAGPVLWPYPERIETPPLVSYGYHKEAWLLLKISAPQSLQAGDTIVLSARVDWMECAHICVPQFSSVQIKLPVKRMAAAPAPAQAALFARARSLIPLTDSEWQVSAVQKNSKVQMSIVPPEWFKGKIEDLHFFSERPGVVDEQLTQAFLSSVNQYELVFDISKELTDPLTALSGVLVSQSGWRGQGSEKGLYVKIPLSPSQAPAASMTWVAALLFAFIGGLLLNLMPCVLPVLSLKILGFVAHSAGDKSEVRKQGVLFFLGVLVSFWVLAGLLIVLRLTGQHIGWGFQLQSPVFVAFLCCLFFFFALNLFGVFEIGTSFIGLGRLSSSQTGAWGAFLSGVLATVVATPCTAPFMGSAVGFGLSQSMGLSLLIFTFLGMGMAFPYLTLSFSPGLLRFIPKPGPWMIGLKRFFGFLFMGTLFWLVWVFGRQTNMTALGVLFVALVLIGGSAWVMGHWGSPLASRRTRFLALAFSLGLMGIGGFWIAWNLSQAKSTREHMQGKDPLAWEPYTQERVEELRKQNKPVFVDFTAAWCLTCQVNERVVLHSSRVVQRFQELGIVTLKADWTSYDEKITRALQQFGRSGVPLYVFYGQNNQAPVILPAIITPDIVLNAVENKVEL